MIASPWDAFEAIPPPDKNEHVLVIGAGLAGCWFSRLIAERGIRVRLLDPRPTAGNGASGNCAGIVKPYVTRQSSSAMAFHVEAWQFLLQQLEQLQLAAHCHFTDCGVMQLTRNLYPESEHYQALDAIQGSRLAGVPINCDSIFFARSGWLNPSLLCRELINHSLIEFRTGVQVDAISLQDFAGDFQSWELKCRQTESEASRHVVIASGFQVTQFTQTSALPVTPARGQISRFRLKRNTPALQTVINGRHYAIPDDRAVVTGATFERDISDDQVRAADHATNLASLKTLLPDLGVNPVAVDGSAGVRATTPDRMPLVGPVPDFDDVAHAYASIHHGRALSEYPALPHWPGLYVMAGFGSRGIVTTPLAAQALAEFICDEHPHADNTVFRRWASLLNPVRFQIRNLKRPRRYT
ncbi:MAG: FAD-dependent 5-carboxymethylaminomethyl-2-thiouridine(34) oxidoreductase MnmC [Granulosicoccus sp.]